ncbi:MerR family transcriptional regulator [Roseomonas sp. 18066]|uniref:MerR family transcriptional regulator n=1 Tax=Roseomonas sp. 18066 TaxID=2681412 RepID=UPI001F3827C7|nr:MerR family transcriptional regulator [Roseomonas sp. 18066]
MVDDAEASGRPRKAPTAFRTISEVAEDLQIPQHVLRFWETKFPQLKPLKRGGGRRYYRPEDIALLRRIGDLLYTQGYTIKGVQRLLRDNGAELPEAAEAAPDSEEPEAALPEAGQGALKRAIAELEELAAELRALATLQPRLG